MSGHQAKKGQNTWIYHLPGDKAGVGTSPWLEAIDGRDRKMSFGQLLHEPNTYSVITLIIDSIIICNHASSYRDF